MIRQTVESEAGEGARDAAERFAYATLDALPEHVAVLDARGFILAVNRAWREFAAANSANTAGLSEGANYFAACARATGEGAGYAARFASGLRAVIEAEAEEFTLEYPCHSPTQQRWFIARAKRFEFEGEARAVVTHANITERRRAEEERERLLRSLEAERSRLAHLFTHAPAFVAVLRGPDHVFELANPPYLELVGNRNVIGKPVREALPEIEGQGYLALLNEVFRAGEPHAGRGVRVLLRREPGGQEEERFLDFVYQPMFDADGAVSGIFVHGVDVTDHKRAEGMARASEERYRTLFSSIDEGFGVAEVLVDEAGRGFDHRFLEVNPSFEKQTGIPVEVVLSGKTVGELIPEIERHWSETYWRVSLTGEPERFVGGSDALGRWFDVYVFRAGRPEERRVAVLFNNITERKLAEERLRASEERYRAIVGQAAAGVAHADLSGTFTVVNRRYCDITGYTESELLAQRMQDITHPDDLPPNVELFERMAAEGTPYEIEKRYVRKDGSIIWVSIGASAILDREGKPQSAVAVVLDVTERKRAEMLLDAQKQSLEMVVSGAPLADVLTYLARVVERQAQGRAVASILLLDDEGRLRNGASPSLPEDYINAIDGIRADPQVGTCSAAAARGAVVVTPDIADDAAWQDIKHLPLGLGLRAAWSMPITARDGRVLGTFGTYFRERREPEPSERQAVEILARTAALAVERKLAERRLARSEEQLRAIFEASRDGILVEDGETIVYANRAYARMLGYDDPDELKGRHVSSTVAPQDAARMLDYGRRRLAGGTPPSVYEFKGRRRDGRLIDLEASVSTSAVGGATYITTAVRDISERKRAEEALKESESKYRLLLEQASDGIHTYDPRGNFIDTNPKLCEMLGYSREELLRLNVRDLIPPEDADAAPIRFDELRAGRTLLTERRLLRKDGTLLPVEIGGRMIRDGVFQSIIRDVSERKRAEEALREAYDELEARVEERTAELARANATLTAEIAERQRAEGGRRELLLRLVTAQEEERRRISRELHDQMGQQLAALMIGLETLDAQSHGRQATLDTLRQLRELTDQLSREAHTLAWSLRPPALDDLGLHTALYNYVEEWAERSRVAVDFHSAGFDGRRLPLSYETTLYRIAQEALTNVLKHSRADRVSFILERRGDHVLAVIEDNGEGFDVDSPDESPGKGRRLGLLGMRERVALLGGTLNVESSPGTGTSVFVRVPVATDGEEGGGPRG